MKKQSKYYPDIVKMFPVALADAKFSDEKCLILGEACMQVMGLLKKYSHLRSIYTAQAIAKMNAKDSCNKKAGSQ